MATFRDFIARTQEALERVKSGRYTESDLSQLQYASTHELELRSLHSTGYPTTDSDNERVITQAAGMVEDIENYGLPSRYCAQCGGVCNGGH